MHRGKLKCSKSHKDLCHEFHSFDRSSGTGSSHDNWRRVALWKMDLPFNTTGKINPRGSYIAETRLRINLRVTTGESSACLWTYKKASSHTCQRIPRARLYILGVMSRTSVALSLTSTSFNNSLSFITNFVRLNPPSPMIRLVSWTTRFTSSAVFTDFRRSST